MINNLQSLYRGSIVVIDDEENMCKILTKILNQNGFHVTSFTNPLKALDYINLYEPDVVLTDIRMPEMSGVDVLKSVQEISKDIVVIIITAFGTIEGAIEAMRAGALDYITKPFRSNELLTQLDKAIEHKKLREDYKKDIILRTQNQDDEFIGKTDGINEIKQLIKKIAPSDSAVLIRGESGTGKELVARAIHKNSKRLEKRFITINCASIPENLLESELFGYEKGAFTGAMQTKNGLIELAHGGTLFLDEIGDLPLTLQAKILRVLQEREIQRVGGLKQIPVDIRLLAATNKDLVNAIESGVFRKDLFYRLNVITITLPPMRDRVDDIELLAKYYIEKIAAKLRKGKIEIETEIFKYFREYDWPGNVRELVNVIERILVLLDGNKITIEDLPDDILNVNANKNISFNDSLNNEAAGTLNQFQINDISGLDFKEAKDGFEKDYIISLLFKTKGNVTDAAKISGMSRRNLYDKMEKFGVKPEDFKDK